MASTNRTALSEKAIFTVPAFLITYSCVWRCGFTVAAGAGVSRLVLARPATAAARATVAVVSCPTGDESAAVRMPRLTATAIAAAKTTAAIEAATIRAVLCFIERAPFWVPFGCESSVVLRRA